MGPGQDSISMIKIKLLSQRRAELKEWLDLNPPAHKDLVYQLGSLFYSNLNTQHLRELEVGKAAEVAQGSLELLKVYQGEPYLMRFGDLSLTPNWGRGFVQVDLVTTSRHFLIDSLIEFIEERNYRLSFFNHPVIHLEQDPNGIKGVYTDASIRTQTPPLNLITFVLRDFALEDLAGLESNLRRTFDEVFAVTGDFLKIKAQMDHLAQIPFKNQEPLELHQERCQLFEWLVQGNCILMGYTEIYEIQLKELTALQMGQSLGLCRIWSEAKDPELPKALSKLGGYFITSRLGLNFFELEQVSQVHRRERIQLILSRRFDAEGRSILVYFLVMFTRQASKAGALTIPVARQKVKTVALDFGGSPDAHAFDEAVQFFGEMPKAELFRLDLDEMRNLLDQVQFIRAFHNARLYLYQDPRRDYLRFTFCLANRRFSPAIFAQITAKLSALLGLAPELEYFFTFNRNVYSHHVYWLPEGHPGLGETFEPSVLETWLDDQTQSWEDQLELALADKGETGLSLVKSYKNAFDKHFQALFSPQEALKDIDQFEALRKDGLQVELRPQGESGEQSNLFFYLKDPLSLSQLIPHLHKLEMVILDENTFVCQLPEGPYYLYQFQVKHRFIKPEQSSQICAKAQQILLAVLNNQAESDPLNGLLFTTALGLEEIDLFILYRNYYQQIGTPYQRETINRCLLGNPEAVKALLAYFVQKLSPNTDLLEPEELRQQVVQEIFKVKTVQEDIILRNLLNLFWATIRTNYFTLRGEACLAIKVNSGQVEYMPLPKPMYEIYVHGPHMEGIHLRGALIARGGIRHSDRFDDFRTEVLGLMKTQMMKNVVIVPEGSKGGFITKRPQPNRQAFLEEGRRQYTHFMHSLLSLTDNLVGGRPVHPEGIKAFDGFDPYLVVAADKGTAHLSDQANLVSQARGHWLGDAFASGGSLGYDHKKMGITARGAWECIKLHFLELGKNIQSEDFRVIGIGDMAGDVFGNGMLLSKHIKLVGAFNHVHIFLDPNPNPEVSWGERHRLFHTPGSSWTDYQLDLISEGGGVFERSAKTIDLNHKIQEVLNTNQSSATGEELVKLLLKAPVDLLWNGGIGTYVKSSGEPDSLVADPSNDSVRITAKELRAKVVGEGGNLGFTQEGRVEFDLEGGSINTDAIDNSAGVDTSDHEVNLKILVDRLIDKGLIDRVKERDSLLASLTEVIGQAVICHNQEQGRVLAMDQLRSKTDIYPFTTWIEQLVSTGLLNRRTERLSSNEKLLEYNLSGHGVPRPDLAVVLSYTKMFLYKKAMSERDRLDDPHLIPLYQSYFPDTLVTKYDTTDHPLYREIVGTMLINQVINQAGVTLLARMQELIEIKPSDLLVAYYTADQLFGLGTLRKDILVQFGQSNITLAYELLIEIEDFLFTQVFNLLLHHQTPDWSMADQYQEPLNDYKRLVFLSLSPAELKGYYQQLDRAAQRGLDEDLAKEFSQLSLLHSSLSSIALKAKLGISMKDCLELTQALETHFTMEPLSKVLMQLRLDLNWERRHRGLLIRRCQTLSEALLSAIVSKDPEQPIQGFKTFISQNTAKIQTVKRAFQEFNADKNKSLASVAVILGEIESLLE